MASAAPPDAAPKKPGCRASKRLETTRAGSSPHALRKTLCVFNPRDDAVFTGVEDLVVLARITRRIQALVPAGNLADNGVVPMRTRGKNPRNLGFINVGLQGIDAAGLQKAQDLLLQFSEKFMQLTPVERFPDGPAVSIVVPEEAASAGVASGSGV